MTVGCRKETLDGRGGAEGKEKGDTQVTDIAFISCECEGDWFHALGAHAPRQRTLASL